MPNPAAPQTPQPASLVTGPEAPPEPDAEVEPAEDLALRLWPTDPTARKGRAWQSHCLGVAGNAIIARDAQWGPIVARLRARAEKAEAIAKAERALRMAERRQVAAVDYGDAEEGKAANLDLREARIALRALGVDPS